MRQLISHHSSIWGRRLLMLLVCLYFGLGLGLLTLRYGILPNVDHWRPQVAHFLSDTLGVDVTLGPLQADWRGWDPGIRVQDLRLRDRGGHILLEAPEVQARLSWQALLPGHSGLLRLRVAGMALSAERLADGRVSLLGATFAPDASPSSVALPTWLQWVLAQPLIAFHDVSLRWTDGLLKAPVLHFDQIEAVWANAPARGASLRAAARAPSAGGARVQLRARVDDPATLLQGRWPAHIHAWFQASQLHPADWRPWLPQVPEPWQQGMLNLQVWLDGAAAGPRLTALGKLAALSWTGQQGAYLRVPAAELWLQGPAAQWQALAQGQPAATGFAFALRASGIQLRQPRWLASALDLGALSAHGRVRNAGAWQVQVDAAHWQNADVDARASGQWQAGGAAGVADIQGTFTRLQLPALHRYLPLEVSADARDWLAAGLQTGVVRNGQWLLRGDLADFPYTADPHAGDFRITGDFQDTRIDLVPGDDHTPSWPLLQVASGHVDLHRMDLQLLADRASMSPAAQQTIALSQVRARIPDMEHQPVLTVSGLTAAPGATYMELIRQSPLEEMLHGVFRQARATGDWQVPLALTVPLLHSTDTQVQGRIDLADASLQFLPQAPVFQNLNGQLYFSEEGIRIVQPLKGTLLGGAVQVRGSLGSRHAEGLSFQGRMTAPAVAHFVGVPGMSRVTGSLDYQARLVPEKRGYGLSLTSDTAALALDFPPPLAKPAGQARTLQVLWSDADPQDDVLEIRYGDGMRVDLRHARAQAQGSYFQQAAVGVGRAAALAPGLQLEIAYPLVDLDRWNRIVDEFSIVRRNQAHAGRAAKRPLWPDLSILSVQADQLRLLGTRLDQAVLRVVKTPGEQWSANIRSKQTVGTLKWKEQEGRVQGGMSARFSRLSLGDDPRDNNSLLPDAQVDENASFDNDLEIPGIVLQADDFRLYGRPLGALALEGVRDGEQHTWRLTRLRILHGQTTLRGTGIWRLRGPDRGLSLNADVETSDLGAWMDYAGWKGVMAGGAGSLKSRFEWRDLPWTHDKENLKGNLQIALSGGRLLRLGSHTAKLLELLSLQSIARLTKLDRGLAGLVRQGIPFDRLQGAVDLDQGEAQVRDYKLIGSVGTILLEGSTNIVGETLDMQAVVVPDLDVSGAAIAAGIAINPLIGLGAFITQWLLKTPLAKVMTAHYHITGTWDDPKVKDVPITSAAASEPAPAKP